jgi:hypothetical protein
MRRAGILCLLYGIFTAVLVVAVLLFPEREWSVARMCDRPSLELDGRRMVVEGGWNYYRAEEGSLWGVARARDVTTRGLVDPPEVFVSAQFKVRGKSCEAIREKLESERDFFGIMAAGPLLNPLRPLENLG